MLWTSDLSSGVKLIDGQHKELILRVNALLAAMKMGRGKQEVVNTANFLAIYVVSHFSEEEKYMSQYQYPGYWYHKAEHDTFIGDFEDLTQDLIGDEAGLLTAVQVQGRVCDWLKDHICRTDKEMAQYLKPRLE